MNTPQSLNRALRNRSGSAAISSKKSLFGKHDNDESDIGPMTPLRFAHSSKNTRKSPACLSNITSFRNLFGNESPDSDRSLSPDYARKYTNNGRYELLSIDHDGKENLSHAVDEETRFSFNSIPETPNSRLSTEESALLDENNSNSLSQLMSSDLNLVEKRCKTLHRTPGVTTRSNSARLSQERALGILLRRTQQRHQIGEGRPETNSQSPIPAENASSNDAINKRTSVKARTALRFNNIPSIPARSFYSSTLAVENDKPIIMPTAMPTKSFYSSSSAITPERKANLSPNAEPSTETTSTSSHTSVSNNTMESKTPRKVASMRKRSKSFSSSGAPKLGQRGMVHKIRKPSKNRKSTNQATKHNSHRQQRNRAIAGGTKSCPTTPKNRQNLQSDHDQMLHQLQSVSRILQDGMKNLKRARSLSTSYSMTDLRSEELMNEKAASSSSEDEESAYAQDEELDNQKTPRKFFHSNSRSRSGRKLYHHSNSITLHVRGGGKRKLLNFPQVPKRRRFNSNQEDFDFETEQQEVDNLICRLDQGNGSLPSDSALPYDEEDDAPIPIQPNVIYLTVDELVRDNVNEPMMLQDEPESTIDVQHDNSSMSQNKTNGTILSEFYFCQTQSTSYQTNASMSNEIIIVQHDKVNSTSTDHQDPNLLPSLNIDNSTESYCQPVPVIHQPGSDNSKGYYPIFYPDRIKELWRQEQQQTTELPQTDILQLLRQQSGQSRVQSTKSCTQMRYGVGKNQYQIDAGQRTYGAVQCSECGLTYSTNEAEEELFHEQFHRSQSKLSFPSLPNEHVVTHVPEWDVTARIIVISQVDSNRQWLKKVHDVLEIVDHELGFATQGQLPEDACVYMAIARSTVLGMCVVQPLQYANRMICLEGLNGVPIDCYSSEFYPAKCGISRIWVVPKYRRRGIGRKLIESIRKHYIFGYGMKLNEIAFGAPTEEGKQFAEVVIGRKDFLVYV